MASKVVTAQRRALQIGDVNPRTAQIFKKMAMQGEEKECMWQGEGQERSGWFVSSFHSVLRVSLNSNQAWGVWFFGRAVVQTVEQKGNLSWRRVWSESFEVISFGKESFPLSVHIQENCLIRDWFSGHSTHNCFVQNRAVLRVTGNEKKIRERQKIFVTIYYIHIQKEKARENSKRGNNKDLMLISVILVSLHWNNWD